MMREPFAGQVTSPGPGAPRTASLPKSSSGRRQFMGRPYLAAGFTGPEAPATGSGPTYREIRLGLRPGNGFFDKYCQMNLNS